VNNQNHTKRIRNVVLWTCLFLNGIAFSQAIPRFSIENIFQKQLAKYGDDLLRITYPADSSTFTVERVRFGAWSRDTTALAIVAQDTVRVYPSGAFTGLLKLRPGWNTIPFRVKSGLGIQADTLHIYRVPPLEPLPEVPVAILDTLMVPGGDVKFYAKDELVVRFVGSPGGKAAFKIKGLTRGALPMVELPVERTKGLPGVYEGVYQIKATDKCLRKPVVFYLQDRNGKKLKRKSSGRITVRQTGQPKLVATADTSNLVRYFPGGEIFMDLPEGIVFPVISDKNGWLKIRVAENLTGYVSPGTIRELPFGPAVPKAALYGISSETDSDWIIIRFRLSEKAPFRLVQRAAPERLSVYFYRTHFQDEWTVYPYPDSLLHHFDWEQETDDILRFDIYFTTDQQWGFRGWYEDNVFKLAIRKPPDINETHPFAGLTIALDAGHGGEQRGAVGATGLMEKDVNLVYTYYLARLLSEAGARVVITRPDDRTMSLAERMEIARNANANLFVWLHNNSTALARGPLERGGASTYYTHLQGMPFAKVIYPRLLGIGLAPEGLVHRSYYITRQTDMPVFLVEGAFLSNPEDEMFLMKDENLRNLARAVFDGLQDYLTQKAGRSSLPKR